MLMKGLSIKSRITLLCGICMLAVVSVLIGFSVYQFQSLSRLADEASTTMLRDGAQQYLTSAGQEQARVAAQRFSNTAAFGETLMRQLMLLRQRDQEQHLDPALTRKAISDSLGVQVKANDTVFGVGVAFEPGVMDNDDAAFVGRPMLGNEKGRFSVYQSTHIPSYSIPEKEILDDGTAATYWYKCALEQKRTCVTEPYEYTDASGVSTLMATVAVPLWQGEQVLGVMSVDISLQSLQQLASAAVAGLYKGQAGLSFISAQGDLAADSQHSSGLGKPFIEPRSSGSNAEMVASVPFAPLPGNPEWHVRVSAPHAVVLAPAAQLGSTLMELKHSSINLQLTLGVFAGLAGMLLVWLSATAITRPILGVAQMLRDIASGEGDLTRRLTYQRQDELGELSGWFNRFLDKLQPVVSAVARSIDDTRLTADQAATIAAHTSDGMQQQFREVDQVATASQEMSATSHDVAKSAGMAADAARSVDSAAREGMETINQTTGAINHLAAEIDKAMTEVEALAENSEQIGAVLDVIRSVAEQTNLLALNAAIEAARAGESGRGFAVVADEVRHLAKRTQDSVSEIHGVIERLQSGTRGVVHSMRISHTQASSSVVQVKQAVSALSKISQGVETISDMNLQIASAAEEQSAVSEEVNRNVATIRDVTERLAGQSEESARVSKALNKLANHQQQLISGFKA